MVPVLAIGLLLPTMHQSLAGRRHAAGRPEAPRRSGTRRCCRCSSCCRASGWATRSWCSSPPRRARRSGAGVTTGDAGAARQGHRRRGRRPTWPSALVDIVAARPPRPWRSSRPGRPCSSGLEIVLFGRRHVPAAVTAPRCTDARSAHRGRHGRSCGGSMYRIDTYLVAYNPGAELDVLPVVLGGPHHHRHRGPGDHGLRRHRQDCSRSLSGARARPGPRARGVDA